MRIQLPNDVVAVGYKEVRPYHYEQIFRSESAGFTGSEREFVEAGHGYEYVEIDAYTRLVGSDVGSAPPLLRALAEMPEESVDRLVRWALAASRRDPRVCPAYLDKLNAPSGPGRARYRGVVCVVDGVVYFRESSRPFDDHGKPGSLLLAKWRKWAAKASVQHKASLQMLVYPLPGYWVEWEILDACEALGIDLENLAGPGGEDVAPAEKSGAISA
jgi:hypothetical protein